MPTSKRKTASCWFNLSTSPEKIVPSSHDIENQCLLRPIPKIIKTKLGDEIGMLGAYELAYEKLI